jgi:hypothetical protein
MIIVYGTRCYGRSDAIPGLGHVTCRFVHIMFAPLVPIESVFVLESDESRGMKVPFSFKAAMSGWLRGGAILAGIGFLIGTIANFADGEIILGVASAVACVLAWASFPVWGMIFGSCSAERKRELMAMLGVDDPAVSHAPPAPQPYAQPPYPQQPYPQQPYPQQPYPQQPSAPPVFPPYGGPPPPAGGFGQPAPYGAPPQGYGAPPAPGYGAPPGPSGPPQPMQPPGPPGWGPPRR